MTETKPWGKAQFAIIADDGSETPFTALGRVRWMLESLIEAGPKGCTPIDCPGPRFSAYVHSLRQSGVEIETIHEPHGGEFSGHHGRYVLRSQVRPVGMVEP
jgi:hypothetical protein